jgi:hypothetical protein
MTAASLPPSPPMHPGRRAGDPFASAWRAVLQRRLRGEDEIRRPIIALSEAQQDLLPALNGRLSPRELVEACPTLASARLSRDAARLLSFGRVRQVQGELPRERVVASTNLTPRIARAALRMLPRTLTPRWGESSRQPVRDNDRQDARQPARRARWLVLGGGLLAAAAIGALWRPWAT